MRKYIYFLSYLAVVAVSFVSCGSDDDDIDVPKKDEPVKQIQIYTATTGVEVLDLFDIKLSLYSNGNKQDVLLDRKNTFEKIDIYNSKLSCFVCSSVNGVEGVDSVIAAVTEKPNFEAIVASKTGGSLVWSTSAYIKTVDKEASGDYSAYCNSSNYSSTRWSELMSEHEVLGVVYHELTRQRIEEILTVKQ